MASGLAYVLTKMPATHAIARPGGTCNRKKRHSTLPTFAAHPRNALDIIANNHIDQKEMELPSF
jgi:hypothetical protein